MVLYDIKDFVSQKHMSKYYTVNKLPGFLDAKMLIYSWCMQRQDFK
jgi:hypothetical protein